jgi:hypothetical protein
MGIVLLTLGKLGPLVGAIAGNSRLLAPGVLAPSNFDLNSFCRQSSLARLSREREKSQAQAGTGE